jgi:hypothetical protein
LNKEEEEEEEEEGREQKPSKWGSMTLTRE